MSQITHELVLEVLDGCGDSALREARELGAVRRVGPTELVLRCDDLDAVRSLRRVVAASTSLTVPGCRHDERLKPSVHQRLVELLEQIGRQRARQRFGALRREAAGAGSADMRRLADALAEQAGLPVDGDGDLVVPVRKGSAPVT